MTSKFLRWSNQVLQYSHDSGRSWQSWSSHPLSKLDYAEPGLTYGSPSKGYRTAQILLSQGYVYAHRYVWAQAGAIVAPDPLAAARLVNPTDELVESCHSNGAAFVGMTAEAILC